MEPQTKNLHATIGDAEASNVLGRNAEASSTSVEQRATSEFVNKAQLHTQAEAAMNLFMARTGDDSDAYEDELAKLASDHAEALDALMILPAPSLAALGQKLRIFARHNIASGWWRGEEIAAILACDANRLLPWSDRT
jgi:hypothetical protein